jgi:hypothetical protein
VNVISNYAVIFRDTEANVCETDPPDTSRPLFPLFCLKWHCKLLMRESGEIGIWDAETLLNKVVLCVVCCVL